MRKHMEIKTREKNSALTVKRSGLVLILNYIVILSLAFQFSSPLAAYAYDLMGSDVTEQTETTAETSAETTATVTETSDMTEVTDQNVPENTAVAADGQAPAPDNTIPENIKALALETLFNGEAIYLAVYQSYLSAEEINIALSLLSDYQRAALNRYIDDQQKAAGIAFMSAEQLYTYLMSLDAESQLYYRTNILSPDQLSALDAYTASLEELRRQDEIRSSLAAMDDASLDAYLASLDALTRQQYESFYLTAEKLASLISFREERAYREKISAMTLNELYNEKLSLSGSTDAVERLLDCVAPEMQTLLMQFETFIGITGLEYEGDDSISPDELFANYMENSSSDIQNIYYSVLDKTLLAAEVGIWLDETGMAAQLAAVAEAPTQLYKWIASLTPAMRALMLSRMTERQMETYNRYDPLSEYPPAQNFSAPAYQMENSYSNAVSLNSNISLKRSVLSTAAVFNVFSLMSMEETLHEAYSGGTLYYKGGEMTTEDKAEAVLSKNLDGVDPESGEGTITLESYVTGSTTTISIEKPTDIVLVLDVSGSMSGSFTGSSSRLAALKTAVNSFLDEVAKKNKDKAASEQHRVSIVKFATNTVVSYDEVERGEYYNEYENGTIGIFGDSNVNYTPPTKDVYNKNVTGQVYTPVALNEKNVATAKSAINSISDGGATSADWGMAAAQAALSRTTSDRQKIVIMFTDGEPNHENGFDISVANKTIEIANTLKNNNTTVYTVGIFNGADDSGKYSSYDSYGKYDNNANDYMNRYMQYTSSNVSYQVSAWKVDGYNYNKKPPEINNKPSDSSYYLAAGNSDDLTDIFTTIAQNVNTASTQLGSSTVMKDIISPYFVLDGDVSGITAKIVERKSDGTWDNANAVAVDRNNISYNSSDKTLSVTGFDYAANYVEPQGKLNGQNNYGKKLVVTFDIKADESYDGTYPSNGIVPTNSSSSGLYKNASEAATTLLFPIPYTALNTYGTLKITKTIDGTADASREFIFTVTDSDGNVIARLTLNGGDTKTITGLKPGVYNVTEESSWSWRYEQDGFAAVFSNGGDALAEANTQKVTVKRSKKISTDVTVTNRLKTNKWLDFETGWQNKFDGKNEVPPKSKENE